MRRGDGPAVDFIEELMPVGRYQVSEYTLLVLLADAPDADERAGIRLFLSWADVHSLTAPIAHKARGILERHPPPSPLTADDAIIAATALAHKLPLYTLDPARFAAVPGLTAVRPY